MLVTLLIYANGSGQTQWKLYGPVKGEASLHDLIWGQRQWNLYPDAPISGLGYSTVILGSGNRAYSRFYFRVNVDNRSEKVVIGEGLANLGITIGKWRRNKSGIYLARRDSLVPVVTVYDSVPGQTSRFDSSYFGYIKPIDDTTIILGHQRENVSTYFIATTGKGVRRITVPDTATIGNQTIFGVSNNVLIEDSHWWTDSVFLYLHSSRVIQHMFDTEIQSAFFSYDGHRFQKILARDDTLTGPERFIILCIGGEFEGETIVRDPAGDRWMLQALVSEWDAKERDWGSAHSAILLLEHGSTRIMVAEGDPINTSSGGELGTLSLIGRRGTVGRATIWWEPDFKNNRVVLFGHYDTPEHSHLEGPFVASERRLEPLTDWKLGDEVPGTNGGKLSSFMREIPEDRVLLSNPCYHVNVDSHRVVTFAKLEDSESDVDEGIFLLERGRIIKIVAENDSVEVGYNAVFTSFRDFEFLPGTDELFFVAGTSSDETVTGLFREASGRTSTVVPPGAWVQDESDPRVRKAVKLTGILDFRVLSGKAIIFHATNRGGEGTYVAVMK
jgi:hypothetical protein